MKCINLNVRYDNTLFEVLTSKFPGLQIENSTFNLLSMRTVSPHLIVDTLQLVYFAYLHSFMSYVDIFCGNSTAKSFNIQKKIIKMMAGVKRRVSCRELFKKFNVVLIASEFLLSLLSFIVDNMKF
jgi:hypothetical protein